MICARAWPTGATRQRNPFPPFFARVFADDIEKVKTDLLAKQLEDGFVFQEIITHNKEIVRIALMGGDISKILFGGGGKLRENRIGSCKIAICRNKANDLHIVLKKKCNQGFSSMYELLIKISLLNTRCRRFCIQKEALFVNALPP